MLFLLREPKTLLAVVVSLVVAVVAHGVVQAAVAKAVGDRQPAALGRLSPDPRRHFEPFGIIAALLSGIGWNKPVEFQEPRFRGSRGRFTLAVLSGPLTNILLAAAALGGLAAVGTAFGSTELFDSLEDTIPFAELFLYELAIVNAAVGALTLIPLPPLDGARVMWAWAPRSHGWQQARYHLEERNIGLGLCVLLMIPIFGGPGLLLRVTFAIAEAILDPLASAFGLAVV